ncbi:MAG: hypothetical protein ACLTLQ_05710 [[Clostridium] scindens]
MQAIKQECVPGLSLCFPSDIVSRVRQKTGERWRASGEESSTRGSGRDIEGGRRRLQVTTYGRSRLRCVRTRIVGTYDSTGAGTIRRRRVARKEVIFLTMPKFLKTVVDVPLFITAGTATGKSGSVPAKLL